MLYDNFIKEVDEYILNEQNLFQQVKTDLISIINDKTITDNEKLKKIIRPTFIELPKFYTYRKAVSNLLTEIIPFATKVDAESFNIYAFEYEDISVSIRPDNEICLSSSNFAPYNLKSEDEIIKEREIQKQGQRILRRSQYILMYLEGKISFKEMLRKAYNHTLLIQSYFIWLKTKKYYSKTRCIQELKKYDNMTNKMVKGVSLSRTLVKNDYKTYTKIYDFFINSPYFKGWNIKGPDNIDRILEFINSEEDEYGKN